jgi:Suppressor of fused protein (SUFU)
MIVDAIRDLYVVRWGRPSRNARFHVDGLDVEVFKWNAETNPEGVNLYPTIGASARPMAWRDPNHRLECFVGLLPAKDDIASRLAALALYSTREDVALDHGHTVPADGPLWSGAEMHRFLVLRPSGDIVAPLELPNGLHIDFLQAIPIYDTEATYKTEHGAEALLQRWERSQVPCWNPDRTEPSRQVSS